MLRKRSAASPPLGGAGPDARRYENKLLVILFLGFGLVFFDRQALLFLVPFISKDIPLSNTALGTLSGVLALTWALSGMISGRLSDRLGRRKPVIIIAVVLFSCLSASSGLVTGFAALLGARALMGLAEGAVLPASQSLMVEASQEHRRGLNMGLLQGSSAGLLGGILCPLAVVWIATQYSWRLAFVITIVPGLLLALWIWRSVREEPPGGCVMAEPVAEAVDAAAKPSIGSILRQRNIILCVLIACAYMTWFFVIITFAPVYMTSVKGFSPATMSGVVTCLGVAWVVWGFVTPGISDRFGRKNTLIVFTVMAALCPLAVVYVSSPVVLGAVVVLTYTGLGCFTLFMATIPAETVPRGALATALGLVMGIGELAGGFLAPVIAGWASDNWGLQMAMYISAAGAGLVVLLALGLKETAPAVLRRKNAAAVRDGAAERTTSAAAVS
ncbi:MFS transporter [Streptomyces doebereineriae]|uniref:MFS transporter n=1 Tax=Streptomyces doebereineriae TaxID=3075528 RepID=A0ABU2VGI5_9ACTN|nr:MFS transporter [Streptomyces sp. DSM 41640]MDT0484299.1 MFS transporter [Streptomyces sp. DSM 41640]